MLKYTPPDSPDYAPLQQAAESIEAILSDINEQTRDLAQANERMLALQGKIENTNGEVRGAGLRLATPAL